MFLDEYELEISENCAKAIEDIEDNQTLRSLRDFEARFGMSLVFLCARSYCALRLTDQGMYLSHPCC